MVPLIPGCPNCAEVMVYQPEISEHTVPTSATQLQPLIFLAVRSSFLLVRFRGESKPVVLLWGKKKQNSSIRLQREPCPNLGQSRRSRSQSSRLAAFSDLTSFASECPAHQATHFGRLFCNDEHQGRQLPAGVWSPRGRIPSSRGPVISLKALSQGKETQPHHGGFAALPKSDDHVSVT